MALPPHRLKAGPRHAPVLAAACDQNRAIMAARLHPGRRVMGVCGDKGSMMNAQELETAVPLDCSENGRLPVDKLHGRAPEVAA